MNTVKIYIDGASRGNPGRGGIGIICKDSTGNTIFTISKFVGIVTNNQAEYIALIEGLKEAIKNNIKEAIIYSDSELLVNQLNEKYKVKSLELYKYFKEAKELLKNFNFIKIELITRRENRDADILASNGSMGGVE